MLSTARRFVCTMLLEALLARQSACVSINTHCTSRNMSRARCRAIIATLTMVCLPLIPPIPFPAAMSLQQTSTSRAEDFTIQRWIAIDLWGVSSAAGASTSIAQPMYSESAAPGGWRELALRKLRAHAKTTSASTIVPRPNGHMPNSYVHTLVSHC